MTDAQRRGPKVIALAGRKGAGKDSAFEAICEVGKRKDLKVIHLSFAEPLKRAVSAMFTRDAFDSANMDEALWGPSEKRETRVAFGSTSFTVRHALQTLGTEWGRKHLGSNVWVDLALAVADTMPDDVVVVVTDARFENEFRRVREGGGLVWLIERPEPEEPPPLGRPLGEGVVARFRELWRWARRHDSERSFYWPYVARRHANAVIHNDQSLEALKQRVANLALTHL